MAPQFWALALLLTATVTQVRCQPHTVRPTQRPTQRPTEHTDAPDSEEGSLTPCDRIDQALRNLWDVLPNSTHEIYLEGLPTSRNEFRDYLAKLRDIDHLACEIAKVTNNLEFIRLFKLEHWGVVHGFYREAKNFVNKSGIDKLRDSRDFLNMAEYFSRITGFPNFPLDIYSVDMARFISCQLAHHQLGQQLLSQVFPPAPDNFFTEENINRRIRALMSSTLHGWVTRMDLPPSLEDSGASFFRNFVDTIPVMVKYIDLLEILKEIGFFGNE